MRGYHAVVSALCREKGWPVPVPELVFAPPRRWRFDLAWVQAQVAVEVQGGLFTQGRHVRGPALQREFEKLNTAQLAGWIVLLILPGQITDGTLTDLLQQALPRPAGDE